ncbi:hypothetical protein C2G38_2236433 [Gigaspora rosea]|uniref:HNH nuclease domain-containing protein n=1 Tax=Gigaspora rosea TaxID=44941 RepID=A0A397TP27_9GLOM|nr:hypothetical protein C2G38_2236433 [Gigaspora rosea]
MTQKSNWQDKFENFEPSITWDKQKHPNKKLNKYRLIKINNNLYYEIQTQKPEITFLYNTYYIKTNIKKNNQWTTIHLHRMIHPKWKMIDHINRSGLDNHECNLNKTTPRENALNRKLFKTNTIELVLLDITILGDFVGMKITNAN